MLPVKLEQWREVDPRGVIIGMEDCERFLPLKKGAVSRQSPGAPQQMLLMGKVQGRPGSFVTGRIERPDRRDGSY